MNASLSRPTLTAWTNAHLRPQLDSHVEWVWQWARVGTVLLIAVGATVRYQGTNELQLVYLMTAIVWAYSVGIAILLRRGYLTFAFSFGITADTVALVITRWIVFQIPEAENTDTDIYLILFPILIAGVFRLGPWLGSLYAAGWIGMMALLTWNFIGPQSYAAEQLPLRVLFLSTTVVLTGILVSMIRSGRDSLAASEGRFRAMFDAAPAGIALVDLDRRAFVVNDGLINMLKMPREEIIGRRLSELEDETSTRGSGVNFKLMTAGETERVSVERRLRCGDGTFIWVNAITSAVRDPVGEVLYAVRIIEDITERKRLDFAKDELMALTSHELKTPLTAIHAALGLAASGALGDLPEKANAMIGVAAKNSDRLVSLVQDILDLESMRLGRVPLRMVRCDPVVLIQKTAELLGPAATEYDVTLSVDSESLDLVCAEDKIQQVLTNLAANAMKFSPGGVVTLACHWADGFAMFEIKDNGPGIPTEQQDIIFERFRQAEVTATRTTGGTGLGLAIAKAIVEGHHGRIWVESAIGQGSVFKFTLPCAPPSSS